MQPEMNTEGFVEIPDIGSGCSIQENIPEPIINSTTCLRLYHGSNVYGEICPWYQFKHVSVSWRGIKVCKLVKILL